MTRPCNSQILPSDDGAAPASDQPLPPPAPAWVAVRDPDVPQPLAVLDGDFLQQALRLADAQLQARVALSYPRLSLRSMQTVVRAAAAPGESARCPTRKHAGLDLCVCSCRACSAVCA